jgi:hypothetical protein
LVIKITKVKKIKEGKRSASQFDKKPPPILLSRGWGK